ncbi:MAG TPA: GAF domain-containing protein [Thermodesulfovibrionales bacterium]|nr:GAF domain-containing protein [Thermodesulfovibrionales bacterium]
MYKLLEELISSYDLEATLNVLARNVVEIIGVKGCTIRLLDEKTKTLQIGAAYGMPKSYLERGPVLLEKHPIDQKVLEGECVSTKDITKEPHVLYLEEAKKVGIKSAMSCPLMVHEKAIGVIRLYASETHDFTDEEIKTIRILASLGGVLVDRAKIWKQMQSLIEISRSLSSTLSLNEVLSKIVESAAKVLGFKAASIRLLDEERKTLEVKATFGLSEAYLKKGPIEIEKSYIDVECTKGCEVTVSDVSQDRRLQYPEEIIREGIGAILSVPLSIRGTVIGVIRVYTSHPYSFTPSERDFLSALASSGAIAIENARLFEHIKSEYEELTKDVWKWYDWGKRFPKF